MHMYMYSAFVTRICSPQAVPSVLSRRVAEYEASDFSKLLRMPRHAA